MRGLPGGVDHHFSPVEFEEDGEACPSSAFIQWGPLQLVVRFTDTGGLSMAVDHPQCRPSLHSLNLLMFLVVYGSQTLQAYSRTGRTNALYALSLV